MNCKESFEDGIHDSGFNLKQLDPRFLLLSFVWDIKMKDTLLIIDDDAKLNQLLSGFLSDFGYKVIAATRPEEGLKRLKQESPDLIILDVKLPGMNGFELC